MIMGKSKDLEWKEFPVMVSWIPNYPGVPWKLLEPYREQAMVNHHQTLERLAERGGLSPAEIYYVINGRSWPVGSNVDERVYLDWLIMYISSNDHLYHEDNCKCFECWNYREGPEEDV